MKAKLLASLLLLSQIPSIAAHQAGGGPASRRGGVYLDPTKPTVYLTVDRVETGEGSWLRLHNNTKQAIGIRIHADGPEPATTPFALADGRVVAGLADGAEVALDYLVESPLFEGYPLRERRSCTKAAAWIPPGLTVVFKLDRAHLAKLCRVSVGFNYEWENIPVEPEHRVLLTWREGGGGS